MPKPEELPTEYLYEWAELRNAYRYYNTNHKQGRLSWKMKGSESHGGGNIASFVRKWKTNESSFYGGTTKEALEYLESGYDLPLLKADIAPAVLDSLRPKWKYSDNSEGDFQHDLFESGDTDYFLGRNQNKQRAGIRVRVRMNFLANTKEKVIAEFGAWIGTALKTLESCGYDMDVTIDSTSRRDRPMWSDAGNVDQAIRIRVTRFGERVMFRDWSALFSPIGYRHLVFLGIILPSHIDGRNVSFGLGASPNSDFGMGWSPHNRTLEITTQSNGAKSFPQEEMDQKLATILKAI